MNLSVLSTRNIRIARNSRIALNCFVAFNVDLFINELEPYAIDELTPITRSNTDNQTIKKSNRSQLFLKY